MNPEIKERWIKALESGEYKHGSYALRSVSGKFCALGVLADIYSKEVENVWGEVITRSNGNRAYSCEGYTSAIPIKILKWAGVHYHLDKYLQVTVENDKSDTFNEAIKYIKEQL